MNVTAKPQYVLRLPGISLKNYQSVEDVFDDRLLSRLEEQTFVTAYNKIPISFNGLDTWPKQTNLKCLICERNFVEIPKFYPKDITKNAEGIVEMSPIVGMMCSFACVRSYIDTFITKKDDKWSALERLF